MLSNLHDIKNRIRQPGWFEKQILRNIAALKTSHALTYPLSVVLGSVDKYISIP